jgi:hypothetical protein
MSTETKTTGIPPEIKEDMDAVAEHIRSGKPLGPETTRRIRERAEKITRETYEKHGLLDIAVPAIRELRDS